MKRLTMVIFFSAVFFLWNMPTAIAQFSEAGVQKLKIPMDAPDFTLRKVNGGMISLNESKGKIVIVNFFTYS